MWARPLCVNMVFAARAQVALELRPSLSPPSSVCLRQELLSARPARARFSRFTGKRERALCIWASSSSLQSSPATRRMYKQEVAEALKAVRLACHLCQTVQRSLLAEETQTKSDKSPVTVADYGSQALVSWSLAKAFGDSFRLVAEEDAEDLRGVQNEAILTRITELVNETIAAQGGREDGEVQPLSSRDVVAAIDRGSAPGGADGQFWVLDPIDGTRGFVRGDQYAVALGLLDGGVVVAGVLGCPNLPVASIVNGVAAARAEGKGVGVLFFAEKGGGTFMQPLDGSQPPEQVRVSAVTDPTLAAFCESFEAAHSQQSLTASIAKTLGVTAPPVRIDSQAKYGAMARGDASIYMRFPHRGYREKIWDHCAGLIVIEEAGGVVLDAGGKPLDFSRGRFLDLEEGIVATNAALMPALLAAVQSSLKAQQDASST